MHRCIAVLLLLVIPSTAFAWGRKGHRIIAAVAERRLGPNSQALKEAVKIVGVKHLADVAARPDDWVEEPGMKQTAAWHSVNIPFDQKTFDADRDCLGRCVWSTRPIIFSMSPSTL